MHTEKKNPVKFAALNECQASKSTQILKLKEGFHTYKENTLENSIPFCLENGNEEKQKTKFEEHKNSQ